MRAETDPSFHFNVADPDPTFHVDVDSDPDSPSAIHQSAANLHDNWSTDPPQPYFKPSRLNCERPRTSMASF